MCTSNFYGTLWGEGITLLLHSFNIQKIYSFHLEVFQMWFFGSVIRELSGPCSADTEYVISMQVTQEYICCL